MTLKEARDLRAYIHSKSSVNCTVPLGNGPDGYFPRSILRTGWHDWTSRADFRNWLAQDLRARRRIHRDYERLLQAQQHPRARSPIELMIDRACGLV